MGYVLSNIVKKIIFSGPESISSDFTSQKFDISGTEDNFAVQVEYSNGDGSVDLDLILEISVDGENFAAYPDSTQNVTDDSGVHIWDCEETGTTWARVRIVVNAGSVDLQEIYLSGKRRH